MDRITEQDYMENPVTVGIFWVIDKGSDDGKSEPKIIFDSETYGAIGKHFINYEGSHFDMWDKLVKEQFGGKYKHYDCYYFPRGRVLYNCDTGKTLVYADKKILDRLDIFRPILENMFMLIDYEFCYDEHYQSQAVWNEAAKLEYKILRGKDKIGANILKIARGGTKILVEFGRELDAESENLTTQEQEIIADNYDACIISHYHGDHAANVSKLNCPVYMGMRCKNIMQTIADYTKSITPRKVCTFRDSIPFLISGIKITPFLCDHSAMDSYMLLFEDGKKQILYTGDFRSSGRKNYDYLLKRLPTKIDVLITEGTNLGQTKPYIKESDLETRAYEIMSSSIGPVFILQSSVNVDRLVSFYRAAKRSRRRFLMDDYQSQVCEAAGGNVPRPDMFLDVFAFAPKVLKGERYEKFNKYKNKISWASIGRQKNYCMLIRTSHLKLIKSLSNKCDLNGATLIYSMWDGYKQKDYMKAFLAEIESFGIKVVLLHTSGHADKQTIDKLISHTKPKTIEYIHTEIYSNNGENYDEQNRI